VEKSSQGAAAAQPGVPGVLPERGDRVHVRDLNGPVTMTDETVGVRPTVQEWTLQPMTEPRQQIRFCASPDGARIAYAVSGRQPL
jgi:hypothetical protein